MASAPWRRWPARAKNAQVLSNAEDIILENDGVKLLGHYHPPKDPVSCPGMIMILHGWEGSANSTYVIRATGHLHRLGYGIFRLNFRDHGETQHLNRELFHSCRLDEVVAAVGDVAHRYQQWPLSLLGYSLGGNFSLRVATQVPARDIALRQVVAVCPLIDPAVCMDALESGASIYRQYFMRKWRKSLRRKQALFPNEIAVESWMNLEMRELTARLVEEFTEFSSVEDYFTGYSVAGDRLSNLEVPCQVIAAADDPVIPVCGVEALPEHPNLQVSIYSGGGHCGFVERWIAPRWLEQQVGLALEHSTKMDELKTVSC